MRIRALRATPVNIPLEAPMWWTGGLYPGTSKTVIEIETDQGLVGLALQLQGVFEVSPLRHGLMTSSPDGPGDDQRRLDPALR
jgi:L-alanine-DL-glutamate epimerase-like enolase superfamily enzyme